MLNIQEMKDQSHAYIKGGFLYTPIYSPHDILALINRLESAEAALKNYTAPNADHEFEIIIARPAREHFKKYPCKK